MYRNTKEEKCNGKKIYFVECERDKSLHKQGLYEFFQWNKCGHFLSAGNEVVKEMIKQGFVSEDEDHPISLYATSLDRKSVV